MSDAVWVLIATVVIQLIGVGVTYGRLTEKVKTLGERTVDHGRRITNLENVQGGTGGHGERITGLETWRQGEKEKR